MLRVEDFRLPEELERYRLAVREFALTDLERMALKFEKTKELPEELHPMLRDAGLLRLRLPKKHGGIGLTFSQHWPILLEVAKSHGSIRMIVHCFNSTFVMLDKHGSEEQKKRWFPEVWLAGKGFPMFALTEPDAGSGVDIRTTARRDGNHYVINGTKHLMTYANIALPFYVVAYTGDRSLGPKGISMIITEKDTPGLTIEPQKEMMGIRGCYHGVVHFKDCRVPVSNLLGKEGEGLDIALRTFLDISRLSIAVSIAGPCERMLELSAEHAKKRVTFGKPIGDRAVIQQMLGEMATNIYATKCMIADCAAKYDAGENIAVPASMCKVFAIEMSKTVSDTALNIFGGIGYTSEHAVERHYRDLRAPWFEEGSATIQKLIVGRDVVGKRIRSVGK